MTVNAFVRWSDNTEDLKRNLEQGLDMIDATKAGAERMVRALSGEKLIEAAHKTVAALTMMQNGVNSLNPREATRSLATLEKAMDKLERTGRTVPTKMREMATSLKQVAASGAQTESLLSRLNSVAGVLGVSLSVGAVVSFTKRVFDAASEVDDLSKRLGISAEAAQRFRFAAEQTGSTMGAVERSLGQMNRVLGEGKTSTVQALSAMGMQIGAIRAMRPEDAFTTIADAIARIPDPMTRAAIAQRIFGESGRELLPAMLEGFDKLGAQATVMSDETVDQLAKAQDAWESLWDSIVAGSGTAIAAIGRWMGAVDRAVGEQARRSKFHQSIFAGPMGQGAFLTQLQAGSTTPTGPLDPREFAEQMARRAPLNVTLPDPELTRQAEAETRRLQQISDRMFGRDLIARAADYVGRLKDVSDITKMLPEQQAAVLEALDQAERAYAAQGRTASDAFLAVQNALRPLVDEHRLLANVSTSAYAAMLQIRNLGTKVSLFPQFLTSPLDLGQTLAAATKVNLTKPSLGSLIAEDIGAGIKSFSSRLGQTVMDAITGGGSVGRAAGALLGESIGSELGKRFKGVFSRALGPALGKSLSDVLPGVGALVGSMLGGLVGWLFGPSWKEQLRAFADRVAGSMDGLREKLRQLGDEGLRMWEAINAPPSKASRKGQLLKDVEDSLARLDDAQARAAREFEGLTGALDRFGGVAPKALHPMIDGLLRMNGLTQDMRDQLEALKGPAGIDALREAAERYGKTLDELGKPLAQLELADTFDQLFSDFTLLTDAGADSGAVFAAMADQVNKALDRARKLGLSIPSYMRPLLQAMLDAGYLTDEFGNKLETLDGFTFSDEFKNTMDAIAERLERIAAAFERIALAALPPRSADLEVSPEDRVAGPRSPSGQTTVVVQMNGQVMAKGVAPWLPGEVITMRLA